MTRALPPVAHSSTRTASVDARRFADHLRRFRQRLRLLAAVRASCLALPIGLAVALGSAWLFLPGASLLAALSVGVVLALVTAIVCAISAAPDLASTAASIDRRAALKNSTATALQFLESEDAMASLVVRHGAARLSALDPRAVFPLEYPRQRQLIAASSIAIALVLGASYARRAGPNPDMNSGTNAAAAAGASEASRRSRGADRSRQPVARAGGARVLQPAPSASSAALAQREPAAADAAMVPGGQDRGTARESAGKPNARPSDRSADPPTSLSSAAATGTGAGNDAANAAATARGSVGDATHAAGRAATPGGANAAGRTERGGGGVKGGTLDGRVASVASNAQDASAEGTIGSAASLSRTESLLEGDRVPPALREYVKRYFAAIRAGSSR